MEQSLMLVTDFYEYSMAYTYFKEGKENEIAYFDVFVRTIPDKGGYYVFNGLHKFINFVQEFSYSEEQIDYLRSTKQFDEEFLSYLANIKLNIDMWSVPEGTPVFANEPVITVKGSLVEAQIVESVLLQCINYSSLVTTKASRIVRAARGKAILEFGTRRAHGYDASIEGARAAVVAGCEGTACTEAGRKYDIPVSGTMAHSLIQVYNDEYEAFLAFARHNPENSVFLVDTYDTLRSGVPNAIKVANDYLIPNGYRLKGIRLDSGDLAYLSKKTREMLDNADMHDAKIIVSNSLDEFIIDDLLLQGAQIDIFGVGENLITSKSSPVLGGVYKVVATEKGNEIIPTIKVSNNIEKITNPGYKKLYRFYDKDSNMALADLIALAHETIAETEYEIFDPIAPWKRKTLTNYIAKELQVPIFEKGKLVYQMPTTKEVITYHQKQMDTLWDEVKRLRFPHDYYVDLSQELWDLKNALLEEKSIK
jgi:putative nicotinate phosphoribosyltransferase